jgi:ABC-type multidrug transport system ATPase subunit
VDTYKKLTGPSGEAPRAFVSSLACLNEACTDVLVGGSFNSILGTIAFSVARLRFDEHFYSAQSVPLHGPDGRGGSGAQSRGTNSGERDLSPAAAAGQMKEDECLPYRAMGTFLDPLPGVNGAVHALAVLDSRYVAVGGSFDRAGALNAPSLVLWDRVENSLVCLGRELDGTGVSYTPPAASTLSSMSCFSPEFCCQGFAGDIRVLLSISSGRLLLGGSFAEASSPVGVVSANLAVLDFDLAAAGDGTGRQVVDPKGWRRLPVVDGNHEDRFAGTNGPVTSAVCLEEVEDEVSGGGGGCAQALGGGWFDGLEAFAWDDVSLKTHNATPWGLMSFPLATMTFPGPSSGNVNGPVILQPLDVMVSNATETPPPGPESVWTRPVLGINALLHVPRFSDWSGGDATRDGLGGVAVLFGGKITQVGNVGALQFPKNSHDHLQEGSPWFKGVSEAAVEAQSLISMKDANLQGPECWESETESLLRSEALGLPVGGHGASMSFCCFVGSLCPFEGVAVLCPLEGGYFCLPNMTRPDCCAEGHYCPTPGVVMLCEQGGYCPVGSSAIVPCTWWMWCRKPGLKRPDKIAAGVVALVLVFSTFAALAVLNKIFLRCRFYYRQSRDTERRKRGLLTSRGTHYQELHEPLLQIKEIFDREKDGEKNSDNISSANHSNKIKQTQTAISTLGSTKSTTTPLRSAKRCSISGEEEGPGVARPSLGGRSSVGPVLRERHKVDRIDLQFRDLTVELPGGRRKVLNGVTGGFRSGRVTAVMGPSGCGKTTLISALSNRLGLGTRVIGRTFINGSPESSTALHDVMGFVPQDDIMYEDLTVKENLLYCCQLRADPSMSRAEQRQHVNRVIDSLGLFPSRHSLIGSTEDRGISGGQRKRVNVGMELTSKPLVLFLDEPTSGLDSTTSAELMQYLHRLTATGLTIAAVIHQPRIEVFLGVDDVIFLGRGGRVAYYGSARDAVQYFTEQGFPFEPTVNPADRILDIITKADDSLYEAWQIFSSSSARNGSDLRRGELFGYWIPSEAGNVGDDGVDGAEDWRRSLSTGSSSSGSSIYRSGCHTSASQYGGKKEQYQHSQRWNMGGNFAIEGRRYTTMQMDSLLGVVYEEQLPQRRYPAFYSQVWSCLSRSLVQQHNNLGVVRQDLAMLMVFGLLVGLFDLGVKQYELSVLCMGLTSTLTGVRFFSAERVVFWRECSAGISIPAYFLGKVLSALPCTTLYPLAYLSFYYNMGFPRVSFTFYYLILLWAAWVCFGVGVIMSLLLEPKNAQIGGVVIALVGFLFGGHTPDVKTLQTSLPGKMGMWLSYVRWSIGALFLQDASLAPQCQALASVGALASEGFVSEALTQDTLPQNFEARVVDTEVAHCQQMLINICILYLGTAMVLMWLSGRYRARMIGWDYFKVGLKQWRARLRDRFYGFLQRHQDWLPRWVISLAVARQHGARTGDLYDNDNEVEAEILKDWEEGDIADTGRREREKEGHDVTPARTANAVVNVKSRGSSEGGNEVAGLLQIPPKSTGTSPPTLSASSPPHRESDQCDNRGAKEEEDGHASEQV